MPFIFVGNKADWWHLIPTLVAGQPSCLAWLSLQQPVCLKLLSSKLQFRNKVFSRVT